jgi:nonsense-mediated mRNA decay protein 3
MVPHKNKISKELVSHDTKNNTYNYKHTFYVEIPKINKDDIVVLPRKL